MPTRRPKACQYAGCGAKSTDGYYCKQHRRHTQQERETRRQSSTARGYGYRWQQASKGFLKKHPLCIRCAEQDQTTAAAVVDHVIPHLDDKALFWDRNNWQPLCKRCHDIKTATEDGGFGRQTGGGKKSGPTIA